MNTTIQTIQRRFQMDNYKKIAFNILSNMVSYMKDDIDGFESKASDMDYFEDLEGKIENIREERKSNYKDICEILSKIKLEHIKELRKILKPNISTENGLRYFLNIAEYTEEEIEEYVIDYIAQCPFNYKEAYYILEEKYKKLLSEVNAPKSKFTKENITKDSVMNAKVVINKVQSGYKKEYSNISQLLTEEGLDLEPTIKGGFTGLPGVLKSRVKENSKFVFIVLDGYRIDFYFES